MGIIIVGLDFSKGSLYALRLAIDVANRCGYNVEMVYVDSGKKMEEGSPSEKLEKLQKENQSKLSSKLLFTIRSGSSVSQELNSEAKKKNADMIVIGVHGASGFKEKSIGANAFRIIYEAKCPILCVRETFNFDKKLDKIVLPIDSTEDTRQKIPYASNMAKIFGSEVCFLGLYTSKLNEIRYLVNSYVSQGKNFLQKEGVPFSVKFVEASNVTKSTLDYAHSISADLIIIMSDQEKSFSNLFVGSYTKQMINKSPFPVLCIYPEEINGAAR